MVLRRLREANILGLRWYPAWQRCARAARAALSALPTLTAHSDTPRCRAMAPARCDCSHSAFVPLHLTADPPSCVNDLARGKKRDKPWRGQRVVSPCPLACYHAMALVRHVLAWCVRAAARGRAARCVSTRSQSPRPQLPSAPLTLLTPRPTGRPRRSSEEALQQLVAAAPQSDEPGDAARHAAGGGAQRAAQLVPAGCPSHALPAAAQPQLSAAGRAPCPCARADCAYAWADDGARLAPFRTCPDPDAARRSEYAARPETRGEADLPAELLAPAAAAAQRRACVAFALSNLQCRFIPDATRRGVLSRGVHTGGLEIAARRGAQEDHWYSQTPVRPAHGAAFCAAC